MSHQVPCCLLKHASLNLGLFSNQYPVRCFTKMILARISPPYLVMIFKFFDKFTLEYVASLCRICKILMDYIC